MPRLLFVGDLHGDLRAGQDMIDRAKLLGCAEIIQVGDWGFIWPGQDRLRYLSDYLRASQIRMRFVDGNHDVHPTLFKLEPDCLRQDSDPEDDNCAPYVVYQHRGSRKTYDDGTCVVFMGGAPSIDYRGRIDGVSWWKEEQIVAADVSAASRHAGSKVDIFVSHDSATPPPGIKETSDMTFNYRAAASLTSIRWVMDALKPTLHVHGHYHLRYSGQYKDTQVEGLDCNLGKRSDLDYVYEPKA